MIITDAQNRDEWDNFVKSKEYTNFLQSWDFYDFHILRNKQVVRRIFLNENGQIIAAYAGVVETAKRGTYLAIAGGPIIDWNNKELINNLIDDIKKQGKKYNCVFVRIRPQLELSENSLKIMRSLGLKKSPMYLSVEYAGILNLEKTEAEILQNASQGFRRKLRKAEKENVTIETTTDYRIAKTFYTIEKEHAKRQKFVAFSEDFLTKQFKAMMKNNEAIVYTAKKDNEILAQNFIIFYGNEASYHYGVSTPLGNKYSAAPLLHIKAMQDARKRGIKRYNLWGIVGINETKHRFYGVSEFKRSFGCEELRYTPAHDLIIKKPRYIINFIVETVRKKMRHV